VEWVWNRQPKFKKPETMKMKTDNESVNHPSFGGAGGRLSYV